MNPAKPDPVCVIVVAFNAEAFILDCIASVLVQENADMRVVVVDNASNDRTSQVVRDWAEARVDHVPPGDLPVALPRVTERPRFEALAGAVPGETRELPGLTLITAASNGGFAAGVNLGLRRGLADPGIRHFWILNPDSVASPGAAAAFLARARDCPDYGLITGRACYYHQPGTIQIDGGRINRWTGVTSNANVGRPADDVPMPPGDQLDFAFGGNMMVSRAFAETCGEMPEDYFLYYEEVDWSLRRGTFPMLTCQDGLIYHRAGASIGSPIFGERAATPFSLYFKHRARMMFVRRHMPVSLPVATSYTLAKAGQLVLAGDLAGAGAVLRGGFGFPPPRTVARRLRAPQPSGSAPTAQA